MRRLLTLMVDDGLPQRVEVVGERGEVTNEFTAGTLAEALAKLGRVLDSEAKARRGDDVPDVDPARHWRALVRHANGWDL